MVKNLYIKTTFILFAMLALASCGSQKQEDPEAEGIISKEAFAKVLADFALAESAANMNVLNVELQKLDSIYNFNPLLDNGVTKAQYDSAVSYYVRHPDLYKEVYEEALAVLSELQANRNPVKDTAAK
jgi:hypothetical protein